ncbi:MAG: hypothetical protein ACR5KV_03100 [Wolbachia sp.]
MIDALPTIQARENNFSKLRGSLLRDIIGYDVSKESKTITDTQNKAKVIKMLQNEGQRSTIQELIKDKIIQNFSEDEMKKLIDKGISTHESDMKALDELMKKFLLTIMVISKNDIKEVEEKVNEKVEQMKPSSEVVTTANSIQHSPSTENPGKN